MKFLYVDESGNAEDDPFLSFFGFYVDGYRLKKVMADVRPIFQAVFDAYPENLRELKSSRLVNGIGGWRNVDPNTRKALFRQLTSFVETSGCHGFAFLVDRNVYNELRQQNNLPTWSPNPWQAGARILCMLLQRMNNAAKNNKGMSILIFDDNQAELPNLSEFLLNSDANVDEYYERKRRTEPFDQIIDTAFAIKSDHSELVQISDACAFALRRCAEIEIAEKAEKWRGEAEFFRTAVNDFGARTKFPSKTWVVNPHCGVAETIKSIGIPNLNNWIAE